MEDFVDKTERERVGVPVDDLLLFPDLEVVDDGLAESVSDDDDVSACERLAISVDETEELPDTELLTDADVDAEVLGDADDVSLVARVTAAKRRKVSGVKPDRKRGGGWDEYEERESRVIGETGRRVTIQESKD